MTRSSPRTVVPDPLLPRTLTPQEPKKITAAAVIPSTQPRRRCDSLRPAHRRDSLRPAHPRSSSPSRPIVVVVLRLATSRLAPGLPRLTALLSVLLLPILPFAFSSIHLCNFSAFFLVWLCSFKLLLLVASHDPFHPALLVVRFVACAALPIKVLDGAQASRSLPPAFLLSCAIKEPLFAALVSLRCFRAWMPLYDVVALDGVHVYLMLKIFDGAMTTAPTLAFIAGTASWLFFAPIVRSGLEKAIVTECEEMLVLLAGAPGKLAVAARSVWA